MSKCEYCPKKENLKFRKNEFEEDVLMCQECMEKDEKETCKLCFETENLEMIAGELICKECNEEEEKDHECCCCCCCLGLDGGCKCDCHSACDDSDDEDEEDDDEKFTCDRCEKYKDREEYISIDGDDSGNTICLDCYDAYIVENKIFD
jgi:hypothetical protein